MATQKKGAGKAPHASKIKIPNKRSNPQGYETLIETLSDRYCMLNKDERWHLTETVIQRTPDDDARDHIVADYVRIAGARYLDNFGRNEYEDALLDAYKRGVKKNIADVRESVEAEIDYLLGKTVGFEEKREKYTLRQLATLLVQMTRPYPSFFFGMDTTAFIEQDDPTALEVGPDVNVLHVLDALKRIAETRGDNTEQAKAQRKERKKLNGAEQAERYLKWAWQNRWRDWSYSASRGNAPTEDTVKTENGFDLNDLNRVDVPTPSQTCLMPTRTNAAITGIGEHGETYRVLARNGVVELDEGIAERSVSTIITAGEDWTPMLGDDVWPYQRLLSLMDELRMQHGPYILPVVIPAETAIRWVFGDYSSGSGVDVRVDRLRKLLARLRGNATIDWRQLMDAGCVDIDRVRRELGLRDLVPSEASLFTSVWHDHSPVNRNGLTGPCFAVYAWPMEYVYAVAMKRILRLPDELTDLVPIKGKPTVREGARMTKVKAYLLDCIARMYMAPKLDKRISLNPLYDFVGAFDPSSRARVRDAVAWYLESWTIKRHVPSLGREQKFIANWKWLPDGAPSKTSVSITLIRGGLKALKRVGP